MKRATIRRRLPYLAVVVLALSVRVSYVLIAKAGPCALQVNGITVGHYRSECTGANDQVNYNTTANTLADGGGFRTPTSPSKPLAEHPPMTTIVLGAVSYAFDHQPFSAFADETRMPLGSIVRTHVREHRLFLALLGTFNVALIMFATRRVHRRATALTAGAIGSVYPFLWVNDGLIMSETIAISFVLLLLIVTLDQLRTPTRRRLFVIGALCGALALTRAELLLLAPITAVMLVDQLRNQLRRAITTVASIALATSVVVMPWIAFNLSRFERPVTISTNDGLTFAGTNCEPAYYGRSIGLWLPNPPCLYSDAELARFGDADASVIAANYRTRGWHYARAHAQRIPIVVAARVSRLFNLYRPLDMIEYNTGEMRERWVTKLGLLNYALLFPFCVLGTRSLWRARKRTVFAIGAPAIAVMCSAAILVGQTRLRAPAEPGYVILAAIGIVSSSSAIAKRRESRRLSTGSPATTMSS